MRRRKFIQQTVLASAAVMIAGRSAGAGGAGDVTGMTGAGDVTAAAGGGVDFPVIRVAEAQRKFKSAAVEKTIRQLRQNIGNKEIGWLFENCYPNTLDTTVDFEVAG